MDKFVVFLFVLVLLAAKPALAYIGPGLAVAGVWMLFGPIAAAVSVILILAYFPLRYFYKKYKHKKMQQAEGEKADEADAPPSSE
ncbi:MAG: hypothetical protein H6861_07100 [Rhodospirillales bacterium]|nr:hypothetical protein [Rhodospirillales bacterium]